MWNILFVGILLTALCYGDVSHLKNQHPGYSSNKPDHPLELPEATSGYPSQKPENPLELPGDGSSVSGSVVGYPKVVPDNPLLDGESSGGVGNTQPLPPAPVNIGTVVTSRKKPTTDQSQSHHHHHGEDGKYNPHDDGKGWDIRKSIPGEPGLDYPTYESVPSTSFTCKEKAPGYYADEETRCQVFRVCTTNSLKTHNNFLCPNGSLFNQRVLTCDWWMNVDCTSSSEFYYKNLEIGIMPEGPQLMIEVMKMLEAPSKNPYFSTDQQKQIFDQRIIDNQLQGTGPAENVYLPPQTVAVTTATYYSPPTTTTTTTTVRPLVITSNLNKVETNKLSIDQTSLQKVNVNEQPQYGPPPVPAIDQFNLANVKQTSAQVGAETGENLHVSQELKTSPVLHVSPKFQPILHLSKQNPVIRHPNPLFVSKSASNENKSPDRQLTQTNNAKPLFPSKSDVTENKTTGGQLITSQIIETNNAQPLFVSKSGPTENKTSDGQLFTSQLIETNNAQPLFLSKSGPTENITTNPLFVDKKQFTSGDNSIPQAQKQPQGNLFVSPSLSSNKTSKTDNQLFTSQITQTNNAQPLFVSKSASNENKSPDRQLTQTNNAQPLFLSKSGATENKTTGSQLFTSQLIETNNAQPLLVSKSGPTENKTSDGQLFTSQLIETNNAQPLFLSKSGPTDNKTSDGQLFTSQLIETNNAKPLLVSKSGPTENKTSDGQLFTSQLIETNNTKPLLVSKSGATENKTSDGQLFTSQLIETNSAQPLLVSKSDATENNTSDSQLFNSQLIETNSVQPFVPQTASNENKSPDGQLIQTNNTQPLFVSKSDAKENKTADDQLLTSQLIDTNNVQPLFASRSKESKLFTSPERPVILATNNKTIFTSPRHSSPNASNVSKPSVEKDQLFLSQINQSTSSGLTGYDYQKQTPPVMTQQVTITKPKIPSVTVTKEKTHTVTNSEKTTHIFQNVEEGPEKISLIDGQNVVSTAQAIPNTKTPVVIQQAAGINRAGIAGQQGIDQVNFSGIQQILGQQQADAILTQQQGIDQANFAKVQQTLGQQQPIDQFNFAGIQQSIGQQQPSVVLTQQQQLEQFGRGDITKDQAFLQIDNIQSGLQEITKQQNLLQTFGQGILNPREGEQIIPAPDFGQHFNNNNFQAPQVYSHQAIQPNLFPAQNFPAGGYQYQQPNFHEQNLHNINFHGSNSGQNFNVDVSRDGSAQNYRGESVSQISNGQTHSTYTGQNVVVKEQTNVDIQPSLGFHLNDDFEKNSYISAVLSGLVNDRPSYESSGSSNIGQSQFLPSDVRYSSYQGPSSYIVPQSSVSRLPSDSGYYR